MKYAKLKQIADNMSEQEVSDSLISLVNDNRFGAIVRLISAQKELSADASSQLRFANNHGCLAHAAGVRYGMLELEGRIKQLCEPPVKRGAQPPANK
jgi:hypothetical protein